MDSLLQWGESVVFRDASIALLAALAATSVSTQGVAQVPAPPQYKPAPPTDVSELTKLFEELCVQDFPDGAAVSQFISSHAGAGMPPEEVHQYLHDDPGAGWYIKTDVSLYAVTIEQPPFHTCAIRRMTPEGADATNIGSAVGAVRSYASSIGGKTVAINPTSTRSPNGPDVLSFGTGVLDGAGKPSDMFGIFLSNYHGRAPPPWVAYGTPGVGVEVRLTRQVVGR